MRVENSETWFPFERDLDELQMTAGKVGLLSAG